MAIARSRSCNKPPEILRKLQKEIITVLIPDTEAEADYFSIFFISPDNTAVLWNCYESKEGDFE